MSTILAEVINGHLANQKWSFKTLADMAGLPRNTVYRWTRGEVSKVRYWQDLARAAQALGLSHLQVDVLLETGGHPPVEVLLARATDEKDRMLLARWAIATPTDTLPHYLTSFVGRQDEVARITKLLASSRLVTLTGPGGSGKTRLAIEAARMAWNESSRGGATIYVPLASTRNPESVISTIARALGLKASLAEDPLAALATHLRNRHVLLVLDNLEHVLAAGPLIVRLLRATHYVNALVTSRTRLDVRGEHQFAVHPLPVPDPAAGLDDLLRNPAVTLFADRARAVDPSFTLTTANAPLVAAVCQHLDGLPLGIELGAAKTRQVGLRAMLDRFPSRLAIGDGGPRDVDDRQRTLRATIAWSYDLLTDDEQRLFSLLGVFAGGCTVEAASSVAKRVGEPELDVPQGLESLADQSLLQRNIDAGDEPRYELLETIREYALEVLVEQGNLPVVQAAHAGYYRDLAERAEADRANPSRWLRALNAEYANCREALVWCTVRGQTETGLRLSVALTPFWYLEQHQRELRRWVAFLLAAGGDVAPLVRARGLLWQGVLDLRETGELGPVLGLFAEALELFHQAGDFDGASKTLQAWGDALVKQGNLERASQQFVASLALATQTGNAYLLAHGNMGLAYCAKDQGRLEDAEQHWRLALDWAERSGNRSSVALALNGLGEMARQRGNWAIAGRHYEATLELAWELGSTFRTALALHNLGYVALHRQDPDRASARFTESLRLYHETAYQKGVAECLAGLGAVAAMTGDWERTARLCGASEAILAGLGDRLDTLDRAEFERTLATLRDRLGERLEPLLAEGRAMMQDRTYPSDPS